MRAKQDQSVVWDKLEESQKSRLIVEQTRKYFEDRGHILIGLQVSAGLPLTDDLLQIVQKAEKKTLDNDIPF